MIEAAGLVLRGIMFVLGCMLVAAGLLLLVGWERTGSGEQEKEEDTR